MAYSLIICSDVVITSFVTQSFMTLSLFGKRHMVSSMHAVLCILSKVHVHF